jgi:hypothetical protein
MLTVLPNFLPLVASNLTWRGAPTTLPNRATVAHHLAHDCRASPVGSHRCLAAIGEEFLYRVKAAGFAGSASPVGRACGLRPVPPSWRHSDTIRSAAGHRTRSWAEQPWLPTPDVEGGAVPDASRPASFFRVQRLDVPPQCVAIDKVASASQAEQVPR